MDGVGIRATAGALRVPSRRPWLQGHSAILGQRLVLAKFSLQRRWVLVGSAHGQNEGTEGILWVKGKNALMF